MDPDDWSKVLLAAIPVVGAVAKLLRGAVQGRRGRLVSDADLLAPCDEPGHEADPLAAPVLHINRELVHHLAEVALLRDLWVHRDD